MATALLDPIRKPSDLDGRRLASADAAEAGGSEGHSEPTNGTTSQGLDRTWSVLTAARDVERRTSLRAMAGAFRETPTSNVYSGPTTAEPPEADGEETDWRAVSDNTYRTMALRTLNRIRSIGGEEEQAATGRLLLAALTENRAREGRPF